MKRSAIVIFLLLPLVSLAQSEVFESAQPLVVQQDDIYALPYQVVYNPGDTIYIYAMKDIKQSHDYSRWHVSNEHPLTWEHWPEVLILNGYNSLEPMNATTDQLNAYLESRGYHFLDQTNISAREFNPGQVVSKVRSRVDLRLFVRLYLAK